MSVLQNLEPAKVFKYFEELCAIPRGSGNMEGISDYCMRFAREHSLKAVCDEAKNVIIYKNAAPGYENAQPIILQGHLDMVCQKTADSKIDFEKDGIAVKLDGDIISADGTTLGADNGIAVAIVLAILDSGDIPHPAIEAVFTTDEEIGMVGALALDMSHLSAKRMINIDCEEDDVMTVSCAGGSDLKAELAVAREKVDGTEITITLKNLKGGHSGVCIHEGRVNANILAGRFLLAIAKKTDFDIISINGGDKGNAIAPLCEIRLCTQEKRKLVSNANEILSLLKEELSSREPNFDFCIEDGDKGTFEAMSKQTKDALLYALVCTPNGVIDMSADIEGLVETSLNIGILKTEDKKITFGYALRSNKMAAIRFLEEKMRLFFSKVGAEVSLSGQYPAWEFNRNSTLQKAYSKAYFDEVGKEIRVEAIHAGLECGVFANGISDFDCIAIGPNAKDVHTVNENLSVSSVAKIFKLLKTVLRDCK